MCIAIPGRIKKIEKGIALIDYGAEKRGARLLDSSIKTGDYVIVANKMVVEKVSEKEAIESIKLWKKAIQKKS